MAQKAAAGRTWQPTGDVLETAFSSAEVAESEVTAAGAFKVRSLPGPWLAVTARLRPLGFGVAAFATRGLAQPKLAERAKAGGGRRTRTFEVIRRLIYSQAMGLDGHRQIRTTGSEKPYGFVVFLPNVWHCRGHWVTGTDKGVLLPPRYPPGR